MFKILIRSAVLVFGIAITGTIGFTQEDAPQTTDQSEELPIPPAIPKPVASSELSDSAEPSDVGYKALSQGPVHEAFATPVDTDPTDGVRLYSQAPPEPIVERPPADRPEGKTITWIPGYWSWSDDADKYVWVSGLYRKVPPGRSWVEGYWSEQSSGYRWTSGYWASTESNSDGEKVSVDQPAYLPVPPKSIDNGPSVPAPDEDSFWLPGQHEYVDGQYQWRSGYWTKQYEGWVWQPACYVYTPQGYVFVDGYWDLLPLDRGQLYAPVDFYSPVYTQPNYAYCPSYPLASAAALLTHLFVRPGYPNYYYGNFYGSSYASIGYRPWYDAHYGFSVFSPWIGYYDWNYRRSGVDFVGSMQRYKHHYDAHPSRYSAQTFQPHGKFDGAGKGKGPHAAAGIASAGNASTRLAHQRSFDEVVRRDVGGQPFRKIDPSGQRTARGASSSFSPAVGRNSVSQNSSLANRASVGSQLRSTRSVDGSRSRSNSLPSMSGSFGSPSSMGRTQGLSIGNSGRSSSPGGSFGRSSSPAPGRISTPSFGRSPSLSLGRSPVQSIGRTPSSSLGRSPVQSLNRSPSSSFGRSSSSSIGRSPSSSIGRSSIPSMNRSPGSSFGRSSSSSIGRSPSSSPGRSASPSFQRGPSSSSMRSGGSSSRGSVGRGGGGSKQGGGGGGSGASRGRGRGK